MSYLSLLDSKLVANPEGLSDHNMGVVAMRQGDMTWNEDAIVMRNADDYIGIVRGPPTILSLIISRAHQVEEGVQDGGRCRLRLVLQDPSN